MPNNSNRGFSLVELMIALAVFSIVVAGIVSARLSQQEQHMTQNQAVEMQQTVRAAMYLMAKDIRMTGFDPDPTDSNDAGITVAGDGKTDSFEFSYFIDFGSDGIDNDGDTTTDEADEQGTGFSKRTYSYIMSDNDGIDNDDDGDVDESDEAGISVDINSSGYEVMADNISELSFDYLDKNGASLLTGTLTAVPSNELEDIRIVLVTITASSDTAITEKMDYSPQNNTRSLTTAIKLRNWGL